MIRIPALSFLSLILLGCGQGISIVSVSLETEEIIAGKSFLATVSLDADAPEGLEVTASLSGPFSSERTVKPLGDRATLAFQLPRDAAVGAYGLKTTLRQDGAILDEAEIELAVAGRLLSPFEACQSNTVLTTPPATAEHRWAVARIDAPSEPHELLAIEYLLRDGMVEERQCAAGLAHRAAIAVTSGDVPPAAFAETIEVEAATGLSQGRVVRLPLEPPLAISPGERAWSAIQLAGTLAETTCLSVCQSEAPGHAFASDTAEPPFDWTALPPAYLDVVLIARPR